MVGLVAQGWADQLEVAWAFHCSARTVRRYQRRFEEGGLAALSRVGAILEVGRGWPVRGAAGFSSSKRKDTVSAKLRGASGSLKTPCASCCAGWDGRRPRRSRPSCRLRTKPVRTQTCPLFCPAERLVLSRDADPADRRTDRLLARLGLLEDAPPLFGPAADLARLEFSWRCPSWWVAASSPVPKKSMAVLARPSMGCAPAS